MNVNRNGIKIQTPNKQKPRKKRKARVPLNLELDKATFYRHVEGQLVTIVVPYFSPLIKTLKEDGWRVAR